MKEQLRTEAEKVLQQIADFAYDTDRYCYGLPVSDKPSMDIMVEFLLDFHAQQSKPNTEAIDRLKSIIEACPKGILKRELGKVLKDLQTK